MPLYWFLLVITALASDTVPAREVPIGRAVTASICIFVGWALLTRLAARSASRQVLSGDVGYGSAAHAFGTQMDLLRWLGLAISTLVLIGFGMAGVLEQLPLVGESIALRSLLLLTPAILATAWSWLCELRFDAVTHPRQFDTNWASYLLNMFRMQAAWLVVPVLVLLLLVDLCQWTLGIDPASGAVTGGVLAIVALPLLLPTILQRIWDLQPLSPEPVQAWCHSIVHGAGVRGLPVLAWHTDNSIRTAMVAGFVPKFRRLLLSDALLTGLMPAEVAMVILHEVSHVRRWHLPLRLLSLLPVWGIAALVSQLFATSPHQDLIGVGTGLALSLVVLRWVAYRTEFDADATAVRLAVKLSEHVPGVPTTSAEAATALSSALLAVTAGQPSARKATWLHPSIDSRIQALQKQVA